MLAAEHDDSELVCDSLRYVEPVQLGVQQPRQAPVVRTYVGMYVRTYIRTYVGMYVYTYVRM